MASIPDRLIAGFPAEAWQAFTADIEPAMISSDPNGQSYVKHQVCIQMLNLCFGPDGWQQSVLHVWTHDPYQYETSKGTKDGRYFAEALVRLSIGAPGSTLVVRENIGAQVAGGSRDEARKGAVSEGLKRAASLFGWAPNVYKTDSLSDEWVGETIMRERQRAETAGFELPENHQAQLIRWFTLCGIDEETQRVALDLVLTRDSAWALAKVMKHLSERQEAGSGSLSPAAGQLAL